MPLKLGSLSMFPHSAFWRIEGEGFMKNSCGGIATILAIVILLAISTLKLNEVFQMTTIIATSSSSMNLQPPMTNLSTIQDDPSYLPYMVGLGFYQDAFYSSLSHAKAQHVTFVRQPDGKRTNTTVLITLQNCTASHFSVIPNIETKAKQWGISSWVCLPLNQTYEIGGSYQLSNTYKRIEFSVICDNAENKQDCGYVKQYTLNAAVEPTSPKPSSYYISEDTFLVKAQSSFVYSSKVNKHTLIIDSSVMPQPKYSNTTGTNTQILILQQSTTFSAQVKTTLKIEVSGKSTVYNRSYYKLLEAISYIGGIFQSILAVFFFIQGFNRYFFEMTFANEYFKTKQTKNIDFITYLKSILYPIITDKIGMELKSKSWQNCSKHGQIKIIVNKLLDVIYLNKRIAYLQEAISVLFEQHQLKALHLMKSMTTQSAEKRYQNYRFRQRLIYFIYKAKNMKSRNDKKKKYIQNKTEDQQMMPNDSQGRLQSDLNQTYKENKQQQLQATFKQPQNMFEKGIQAEQSEGIEHNALREYLQGYIEHQPDRYIRFNQYKQILKQEVEYIGDLQDQVLLEHEIVDQLEQDLKKLVNEAQNKTNAVSCNIYSKLDVWLKQQLKFAILQQQNGKKFDPIRQQGRRKEKIRKLNQD